MNIGKEIKNIAAAKYGNKEIAIFYNDGQFNFHLGNPTQCVMLGEVGGEIETSGDSLEEVISKMKRELGI